jgi:hypothetical protein
VHRSLLLATAILLCPLCGISSSQNTPRPTPFPQQENSEPAIPDKIQKDMEKKANKERQAELKKDTEKLVKLSTELKEYVDKSNQDVLSLEVVKKAEEIERLAHNVKTRMRDGR